MRLLMMGTGPFAVPTLEALLESPHEVVAVVTRPRAGRKREASPVERVALREELPLMSPTDVNAAESRAALARYEAELFVVCDFGQILSPQALGVAPRGGINLHGSLLPKYRGAAPVNWAIYHGETVSGVTVIHMTAGLDAGPCLGQRTLQIGDDETADELEPRMAEIGAELVREIVDQMEQGHEQAVAQIAARATKAPRLKKSDGAIDWSRAARDIRNQIRALDPWPKTYTYWLRADGEPLRLILGRADVLDDVTGEAGTVVEADGDRLIVAAGQGGLRLSEIQPAGKRMLDAAAFLRGNRVGVGDRFGDLPTA